MTANDGFGTPRDGPGRRGARAVRKARLRAGGAAFLLLLTGAVLGVTVDRLFNAAPPVEARSLTAGAMAERLGLSPDEEARLTLLLDSLHVELMSAEAGGPETLRLATHAAHRRIEAWLPDHARPAFRAWIQEHREHMMQHMRDHPGGAGMMPGMRHMEVPPDS